MNTKSKRVGFVNRSVAIIAAVLIHAVLIFFLVTNFNSQSESVVAKNDGEIATIMATTVSADEIKNQKKKIQKTDAERKRKERERRQQEQRELDELKRQKAAESKKLEETKQQRLEEEKAIALKRKKEQEKLKKEKELKEKQAREKKRKAEQEKKRKKAEERKKKKAQAEQEKRKAEAAEKKRREDRLTDLQRELASELNDDQTTEESNTNQPRAARNTTTLFNKYVGLITEKVQANFNPPHGTPRGTAAVINIRLDSTGRVISTKVVKSSGSFAFDRAAEVAIGRAAPLPMPPVTDPANAKLQNINLTSRY